jgi:GAF domain-containing protein
MSHADAIPVLDDGPWDRIGLGSTAPIGFQHLFLGDGPFLDDELSGIAEQARRAIDGERAVVNVFSADVQMSFDAAGGVAATSSRSRSMCQRALAHTDRSGVLAVEDAGSHPLFADLPWVDGQWASIRFYAMVRLDGSDGTPLGSLCCFGDTPRVLGPEEKAALRHFAAEARRVLERSLGR